MVIKKTKPAGFVLRPAVGTFCLCVLGAVGTGRSAANRPSLARLFTSVARTSVSSLRASGVSASAWEALGYVGVNCCFPVVCKVVLCGLCGKFNHRLRLLFYAAQY